MWWEANKTHSNEKVYSENADQSSAGACGLVAIKQRTQGGCFSHSPGELQPVDRLAGPLRSPGLHHLYLVGSNQFLLSSPFYVCVQHGTVWGFNTGVVSLVKKQGKLKALVYQTWQLISARAKSC